MSDPGGDPLLQGLAEGREEAFAALYDRFAGPLWRGAVALLGSGQDAEDAVQEVFVGLVRARRELSKVENLRAYLFASLRRAAARIAAARKATLPLVAGMDVAEKDAGPRADDADPTGRLERALRSLPTEQREVVALKLDGGLTFAEVASALGVSANTAASRYRYALEKLRAAFGK